jgi:hypothetical protein
MGQQHGWELSAKTTQAQPGRYEGGIVTRHPHGETPVSAVLLARHLGEWLRNRGMPTDGEPRVSVLGEVGTIVANRG